jgi:two-component system nitrate/nitrite response regulator NarL
MDPNKKQYVMKTANAEAPLRCPTPASAPLFNMSSEAESGRFAQGGKSGARKPIRVLLVDDHPIVRKGLSSCLSRQENIQVIGEAGDGREALRKAKELMPDVVMMDIDMPQMNGLTATELMRKELPNVKVLVLSMHTHSDVVMRILQSGARGYVVKEASSEELLRAVETVHGGESFFSSDVARLALNQFVRGGGEGPQPGQISNREREVLIAIAEGLSNKEIASRLNVGVRTVETHRERIMRKLNIHSVAGLTRFAIQKGLIPLQKEPEH